MRKYALTVPALVILSLALASCASPEDRLRSGLYNAGLSREMSACMANKMVHQLSLVELERLASFASLKDRPLRDLTPDEIMHKVRALRDEHIISVTVRAGVTCAIDPR